MNYIDGNQQMNKGILENQKKNQRTRNQQMNMGILENQKKNQ